MKLSPEEIRLALKTIGRIKTPNYKAITERLIFRDDFRSDIKQSQIEEIHKIALDVGDIEEAIQILVQSSDSAASVKKSKGNTSSSADFDDVKKKVKRKSKNREGSMPNKIIEYVVIRKKFEGELIKEVNQHIEMGWTPIGGVAYAAAGMTPLGDTGNTFIQALVKYK